MILAPPVPSQDNSEAASHVDNNYVAVHFCALVLRIPAQKKLLQRYLNAIGNLLSAYIAFIPAILATDKVFAQLTLENCVLATGDWQPPSDLTIRLQNQDYKVQIYTPEQHRKLDAAFYNKKADLVNRTLEHRYASVLRKKIAEAELVMGLVVHPSKLGGFDPEASIFRTTSPLAISWRARSLRAALPLASGACSVQVAEYAAAAHARFYYGRRSAAADQHQSHSPPHAYLFPLNPNQSTGHKSSELRDRNHLRNNSCALFAYHMLSSRATLSSSHSPSHK